MAKDSLIGSNVSNALGLFGAAHKDLAKDTAALHALAAVPAADAYRDNKALSATIAAKIAALNDEDALLTELAKVSDFATTKEEGKEETIVDAQARVAKEIAELNKEKAAADAVIDAVEGARGEQETALADIKGAKATLDGYRAALKVQADVLAGYMKGLKTATAQLDLLVNPVDHTAEIAELTQKAADATAKLDTAGTGLRALLLAKEGEKAVKAAALAALPADDDTAVQPILDAWGIEFDTADAEIKDLKKKGKSSLAKPKQAALDKRGEEVEAEVEAARTKYSSDKAALEEAVKAFDSPIADLQKEIANTEALVTKATADIAALTPAKAPGALNAAIATFIAAVDEYHSIDPFDAAFGAARFTALLDGTAVPIAVVAPAAPAVSPLKVQALDDAKDAVVVAKDTLQNALDAATKLQGTYDTKAAELTGLKAAYDAYMTSPQYLTVDKQALDDASKKLMGKKAAVAAAELTIKTGQGEYETKLAVVKALAVTLADKVAAAKTAQALYDANITGLNDNVTAAQQDLDLDKVRVQQEEDALKAKAAAVIDPADQLKSDIKNAKGLVKHFTEKVLVNLGATEDIATTVDFKVAPEEQITEIEMLLGKEAQAVYEGFHA